MANRSSSPPTPPPGQVATYDIITMATPIKIKEKIDQKTGAVISRTEERGTPYEKSRTTVTKGSRSSIGTRCIGPSRKPILHFKLFPNRSKAEDAAREAGKGNKPVHHTAHGAGQRPHFHPADRYGNIIKDGAHYEYPG